MRVGPVDWGVCKIVGRMPKTGLKHDQAQDPRVTPTRWGAQYLSPQFPSVPPACSPQLRNGGVIYSPNLSVIVCVVFLL